VPHLSILQIFHPFHPMKGLLALPKRHYLIRQYLFRQIGQRYKGANLGVLWSIVTPLLMLLVYTFVFGTIMNARFGISKTETTLDFALALFCGLNLFNLCAEVIGRSPTLILGQPNLVKKVVFPLEILPLVTMLDALIHTLLAFIPLFLALIIVRHEIPWSFVFLPFYLIPMALFALGLSLFLSALGVFVRDIPNIITPLVTILLFSSAIMYPLAAVPEPARSWFYFNPLALLIEDSRKALIWGFFPNFLTLTLLAGFGLLFVVVGFLFFEKSKPAFADVM
jgi:lipopolysaccharide transport system permease protein